MAKASQYVDLSKFPPNEKAHIIDLATAFNALREDVDLITGSTPEEKASMFKAFGHLRGVIHWLHGKRFNLTLFIVSLYFGTGFLEKIGLDPSQATRLFEVLIKALEKQV